MPGPLHGSKPGGQEWQGWPGNAGPPPPPPPPDPAAGAAETAAAQALHQVSCTELPAPAGATETAGPAAGPALGRNSAAKRRARIWHAAAMALGGVSRRAGTDLAWRDGPRAALGDGAGIRKAGARQSASSARRARIRRAAVWTDGHASGDAGAAAAGCVTAAAVTCPTARNGGGSGGGGGGGFGGAPAVPSPTPPALAAGQQAALASNDHAHSGVVCKVNILEHLAALEVVCHALRPHSNAEAGDGGGGGEMLTRADEAAARTAADEAAAQAAAGLSKGEAKASSTAQVWIEQAARVAALGRAAAAIAGEEKPAWPFRPVLASAASATWSVVALQRWRELRDELLRIEVQVEEHPCVRDYRQRQKLALWVTKATS
jgi:hypothetical protein